MTNLEVFFWRCREGTKYTLAANTSIRDGEGTSPSLSINSKVSSKKPEGALSEIYIELTLLTI